MTAAPAPLETAPVDATLRPTRSPLVAAVRRALFWIHLVIGVSCGVVILIMSATGVMLGYERQLIAAIDGAPTVAVPPAATRLPLDTLLARAAIPTSAVAGISLNADPTVPATIRLAGRKTVLLDPWRGVTVPAIENGKARAFLSKVRAWHRWLAASDATRPRARMITGAANLGFFLLVLSGLWLWWPRRWTRAAVRAVTRFDGSLRGKARDFNWHNTIGFWTAIPLALVVLTGVFMSYQWPGRWLDRWVGSAKERAAALAPRPEGGERAGGEPTSDEAPLVVPSLDRLVQPALERTPTWKTASLTLPAAGETTARLSVSGGNGYRPDLRTQYTLDPLTGAILTVRSWDSLSTSRKLQGWVRFGHTGEVFGVVGQTLATLASLGGVVLVWTGIALAWRRLARFVRRRREGAEAASAAGT